MLNTARMVALARGRRHVSLWSNAGIALALAAPDSFTHLVSFRAFVGDNTRETARRYSRMDPVLLRDFDKAIGEVNVKKVLSIIEGGVDAGQSGFILPRLLQSITHDFVGAQTNQSMGRFIKGLAGLGLRSDNEQHRQLLTELFARTSSLGNMSDSALLDCLQGFVMCGLRWDNISSSDSRGVVSDCKTRLMRQIETACHEISNYKIALHAIINLDKLGVTWADIPATTQSVLLSCLCDMEDSQRDKCAGVTQYAKLSAATVVALGNMGIYLPAVDTRSRSTIGVMVLETLQRQLADESVDNRTNVLMTTAFLGMGMDYGTLSPVMRGTLEQCLVRVKHPADLGPVLQGLSKVGWPWLSLSPSTRTKLEEVVSQSLRKPDKIITTLETLAELPTEFSGLGESLRSLVLGDEVLGRPWEESQLVSLFESLGRLKLPAEQLPASLVDQLACALRNHLLAFGTSDLLSIYRSLAAMGATHSAVNEALRGALEDALVQLGSQLSSSEVDDLHDILARLGAMDSLSAEVRSVLVAAQYPVRAPTLLERLVGEGVQYNQLDGSSQALVREQLEERCGVQLEMDHSYSNVANVLQTMKRIGLKWSLLSPAAKKSIQAAIVSNSSLSASQITSLLHLFLEVKAEKADLSVRCVNHLLQLMTDSEVLGDDNAEHLVHVMACLGLMNAAIPLPHLQKCLVNCREGLRNIDLLPGLLRSLRQQEHCFRLLDPEATKVVMSALLSSTRYCMVKEDLVDLMFDLALLAFDLPKEWTYLRRDIDAFHQEAQQVLAGMSLSSADLNRLAVYSDVHRLLCDPLTLQSRPPLHIIPTSEGLWVGPRLKDIQAGTRDYLLARVEECLLDRSPHFAVVRDGYMVNNSGFLIDSAVYFRGRLVAFLEVDMEQNHSREAVEENRLTNKRIAKRGVLQRRHNPTSGLNESTRTRMVSLRDRIHARYFGAGVPLLRTKVIMTDRRLTRALTQQYIDVAVKDILALCEGAAAAAAEKSAGG